MNTSFASSVQHSGRKNKYPAVKSALLLLFLVFRWWIVHQKLARELHFSRYIYIHTVGGHDHSAFRASDGLSLCTSETDCGFLNCADPEPSCCFLSGEERSFSPSFSPIEPPFSTCSRAFYGDGWNVGFSWRNAAACGELDRAANEASLRSGHSG